MVEKMSCLLPMGAEKLTSAARLNELSSPVAEALSEMTRPSLLAELKDSILRLLKNSLGQRGMFTRFLVKQRPWS